MINSNAKIENVFRISRKYKNILDKLGIITIKDLLYYFPTKYEDLTNAQAIAHIQYGKLTTIYGEITDIKKTLSWKHKRYVIQAKLSDTTGSVYVKWFNQPYMASILSDAKYIKITGKLVGKSSKYFANPDYEILPSIPDVIENKNTLVAIYPEKKGLPSKWIAKKINEVLESGAHKNIKDIIPKFILEKYNLPDITISLYKIHKPKTKKEVEAVKKRFAFETVFKIQLQKGYEKIKIQKSPSFRININKKNINEFIKTLPYKLTKAQKNAIDSILLDLQKPYPMQRLIQGDVGSGKTTVAAAAAFAIATNPLPNQNSGMLQSAYMAPTEILAKQQFYEFISFFSGKLKNKLPKIALLTSNSSMVYPSKTNPNQPTKISKNQLLKWVKDGSITVLVGTHSLIQKNVEFKALALTIVDEQHRFGVKQRAELTKKSNITPHFISMTATPIPRTLALTIYGNLDISIIDELPPGRKKPKTKLIKQKDKNKVYDFIKEQIKEGRQAYVICPRIDEPDPKKALALKVASVMQEYEKIKKEFKEFKVGMIHGKMNAKEKDEIMQKFENKQIDILVSTTVIEVGVNVPNATIMIIEGAERFGLAQLHQLRGRIQRSSHQPYCFLFTSTDYPSPQTLERLKIFEKISDGFKLSEHDLKLRGAGELSGTNQWGISDIAMEAIQNIKMVEFARKEAQNLLKLDQELTKYPELKSTIKKEEYIHLE